MSETVLELAMRTAIRDAYDDAASIVRGSTSTSLPQSELDALADVLLERAKTRPRGPQEWWAGAQADVAGAAEAQRRLAEAFATLPAHRTVLTLLLRRVVEMSGELLPAPARIPLVAAAEAAIDEVER
jgi:hypothetical protein